MQSFYRALSLSPALMPSADPKATFTPCDVLSPFEYLAVLAQAVSASDPKIASNTVFMVSPFCLSRSRLLTLLITRRDHGL